MHFHAPTVLLHDTVRQRQAEARAFAHRLGGEEGVKNTLQVFLCNACASVGHLHPHIGAIDSGADGDGATLSRDGVGCVDQQVHEHLVQLRGQALNFGQRAVVLDHVGLVLDLVVDDVECGVDTRVQVHAFPLLACIHARKIFQVLHDFAHALDAVARLAHQVGNVLFQVVNVQICLEAADACQCCAVAHARLGLLVGVQHLEEVFQVLLQGAEVREDEADGVVDLMRHTCCQLPDGGQLFRLDELALRIRQLGVHLLQVPVGLDQLAHDGADLHV